MVDDSRPRIGVLGHGVTGIHGRVMGVNAAYLTALLEHGGLPVLIPSGIENDQLESYLALLDGILLPGGADMAPELYGEARHESVTKVDPDLDETEMTVIAAGYERDLPMLAICRGMQTLNVTLGGTLIQDLPSERPGLCHEVRENGRAKPAHGILLRRDSRFARIVGTTSLEVNTLHHQAIRDVAPGLRAVAEAPDATVEALEAPGKRFTIGVQCHPEEMWNSSVPVFSRLFTAFVEAARAYSADREHSHLAGVE